ncbi:hypothetical protein L3Q82_000642 [Scortum barcoo]|uniref:Uncharacterized protein n=1 Tax=Scortum barcoo TaxID=214431 RepID=A0ACB8WF93_9TELE|nr:hypothetical protein L3Q82_000642 [Scortum barcoo]
MAFMTQRPEREREFTAPSSRDRPDHLTDVSSRTRDPEVHQHTNQGNLVEGSPSPACCISQANTFSPCSGCLHSGAAPGAEPGSANPRGETWRSPLNFGGGEGGAAPELSAVNGDDGTNLPSLCYHGKCEVSAEQDGRASGADEAAAGVPGVQPDALHRDLAEPPHPGLTGAAGRISSRQSGQEYKGEWDIELLLAVSIRPYYLPREFSHVIAITTYIPPSANADAACELLHSVVAQLQTEHPQSLSPHHRGFQPRFPVCHSPQLPPVRANCCTRDNKTLDLLYANTAGAYSSSPLPPLGRSDHNLVHLRPVYTPMVKRQPPNKRRVKQWSEEASDALRDCFDTTDWEPWVTPDLRALLQEKRTAFQSGDRDELRRVQRDLKRKIKECKASYRRKMEDHLQQNNARGSLSTDQPTSSSLCLHAPSPPSTPPPSLGLSPSPPPSPPSLQGSSPPPPPSPNLFTPTVDQVRTQLKKIKARKATGPDGISSRLLRDCADQLFPKTLRPKELNHFRPVALTSHLMKDTGEDRPQAPLPPVLSTPIHPSLPRVKLERAGASDQLAAWVTNYLTDRPQFVRLQDCVSDVVVCSTGAPQGTVLSPFLFTLYTSDFTYSTDSCHLQKFSDDTAIVGCVSEGNDCEYRKVIMDFVDWCELNHLQVNASKTKEMVIDFSRKPSADIAPLNIQGLDIERVRTYKYLGVHLNNKLDWTDNTDSLYKRGQSRLYMLRRLGSFGVCRPLLRTFYETVVASVVSYAVVCWGGGCSERDKKRLNRLIKRASSVCGCPLDSIEVMGERRALAKLSTIMDNTSHPLHQTVGALSSSFSNRLRHPRCRKERFRRSFIPNTIRLFNAAL